MNWLVKGKTGLIILSALLFLSCDNEELLSLDFNPQDENINISFTELTLPSQLVQRDTISTTNVDRILVGNYQNPDFGTLEATGYVSLGLGSSTSNADDDDELDSLVLVLVRNYFYGNVDASLEQTVDVYQLEEAFVDTLTYFSDSSLPFRGAPLTSFSFTADPEEADTLRVRMSDAVGNDLLSKLKSDAAELDSSALFRQYFRGLALSPGSENSFMTGFSRIQMLMYYSAPADTVSKSFNFTASRIFNGIETDRSGTAIADIDEPREVGSPTDDRLYLQSSSGLISRIDMQPLLDFVESSEERILLNRVVLHIGLSNEVEEGLAPPPALFGYLVEDDGYSRIISADQNGSYFQGVYSDAEFRYDLFNQRPAPGRPSTIAYDSTDVAYNLKITSFSQTLLDGYVDNSEILLFPSDFNSSITQLVTSADSVKLRVYYSRLR